MGAASLEVLWKRDGACFRVAAYPLGCGTEYVMDKILTGWRAAWTSLFQFKFVFLIGFSAQIGRLAENESTILIID